MVALRLASSSMEQLDKIDKIDELSIASMLENMEKLEKHVQTSLKQLIRIAMNRQSDPINVSRYKQLYSSAIQSPVDRSSLNAYAEHLKIILSDISAILPDIGNLSK